MTVIPIAMRNPNFELRTHSWVTKVIKDSDGKRVTGVTYTNVLNGEEFEQPAGIVLLCAYAINNVHLMLLSGIGEPYDPVAQKGVIGKNYCYQTGAGATLFFEGRHFNPFMNAGGSNVTIDDFNINWEFDRGPHGFVGGYNVAGGFNTVLPIGYRPVPSGTPQWGKAWKAATAKWYQTAMKIGASGSVMANRYNYFDLDPTYRNAFGQPLMRMTFDYKENEHKMGRHAAELINTIAKSMNPTRLNPAVARTEPWTVVPYQSTHNTGGTIMGTNPRESERSTNICRAGTATTCSWSAPTCSRTTRPTIRPGRWARSPTGRWTRSRTATSRTPARWCRHEGRSMVTDADRERSRCCWRRPARRAPTATPRAARSASRNARPAIPLERGVERRRAEPARRVRPQGRRARRFPLLAGDEAQRHHLDAADARHLHRRSAEGGARQPHAVSPACRTRPTAPT